MPDSRDRPLQGTSPTTPPGSPADDAGRFEWEIRNFAYESEAFALAVETARRWGWRDMMPVVQGEDPNGDPIDKPAERR